MEEKKKSDILKEKLFYSSKSAYEALDVSEINTAYSYCEGYKKFLDGGKTERECVKEAIELLEKQGFVPYEFGTKVSAGEKYYYNNRGKSLAAFVIGTECICKGVNLTAAHIDSPRLDLKQHPLYETEGLAYFKTHYYGGIKKYQWTATPLALHGVITKSSGETVDVCIGEDDCDPIFYISDLLPHFAGDQMRRSLGDGITGEQLNILCGSRPYEEKTPDGVKLNVISILNEKYGVTEADLISAELSAVPAAKARDIGFDRSLIGGYGHDDRVCAYPSLTALCELENPAHTSMAIIADKEEIGSEGNSGMQCAVYFDIISDLAKSFGADEAVVRKNSKCLSADVGAAFDPNFPEVAEKRNACYLGKGIVITKFTGSRGKSGSNDAGAEYFGYVRNLFDGNDVLWQFAELGRVDGGGGGTVAKFIARQNVDTIDIGVPVISMHAPWEVVSKTDVYMAHKAISTFFKN